MKVRVDSGACEKHGQCVLAAPEVFSFDQGDNLVYEQEPPDALASQVAQAVSYCPAQAISVGA